MLATYLAPVWTGNQPLTLIQRGQTTGPPEGIGDGFERLESLTAVVVGVPIRWAERRLVIRSYQLAQAGKRSLRARLAKAQAATAALNDRRRDGAGGAVCRQPEASDGPSHDRALAATL
jgi:hypothetical protein